MKNVEVKVTGSGSYLPGKPVPFDEIERYLGPITNATPQIMRWLGRIKPVMKEMLDIEYYHYAINPDTREYDDDNITMSVKAARAALVAANLEPADIDFIAYGSAHMDQMPTASVRIQAELGIERCAEIGVHANCTSAYKALLIAHDMIKNGRYKRALVVSSSVSSSELRAEYYNQALATKEDLFLRWFLCDGAGAIVLEAAEEKKAGLFVECCHIESIGGKKPPAMGNKRPAYWMNPKDEYDKGYHHLAQMFQEELRANFHDADGTVFYKGLRGMIEKYTLDLSGLRFFQVNLPSKHIAELVMEECFSLGIPRDTLYTRMSKMGYSGPPMVFICLDKILREEKLAHGDLIVSFVTEVSKFMQAGYAMRYY
jgi:3-oxoacyl-[acyl-carrier-protein] synthase III